MAEQVGIVRAVFRYFKFWNWKKARGIIDAADEQFAGYRWQVISWRQVK